MKRALVLVLLFHLLLFAPTENINPEQKIVKIFHDALINMDQVGIRYVYTVQEVRVKEGDEEKCYFWLKDIYPVIFFEKVDAGKLSDNFIIMNSDPFHRYMTAWFIIADGKVSHNVEKPPMGTFIFTFPFKLGNEPVYVEVEKGLLNDELTFNPDLIDREALKKRNAWLEELGKVIAERQMENVVRIQLTELRKLAIETSKKIRLE